MEKKLEVKNLKISFRTDGGKVQAVRNINFDLYKGETLAIVGESGSGKSVTSKAIMGISAGNAIVDSGEIIYDGKDLLTISEEDFHEIRGDKIAMIFQDPMSSLNPIMRVGKQITEAMLLKNKANRKEGRASFNKKLAILAETIKEAIAAGAESPVAVEEIETYVKTFDEFNIQAIKLENSYNESKTAAAELIAIVDEFLFLVENRQKVDMGEMLSDVEHKIKAINDKYFASKYIDTLNAYKARLSELKAEIKANKTFSDSVKEFFGKKSKDVSVPESVTEFLAQVKGTLTEMLDQTPYNFFRIGYYVYKNKDADLTTMSAEEANEMAFNFLQEDYMLSFLELEKIAVKYSFEKMIAGKKEAVAALEEAKTFFMGGNFTKAEEESVYKNLCEKVEKSIDPLQIVKDNAAYTFAGALKRETDKYFFYIVNNPKEEERFAKQTAKRDALIAKGKSVDWKVVPKSIVPPEQQIEVIVSVLQRVIDKFENDIENAPAVDYDKRCVELVDYLKEKASQVVFKLTKSLAKERAIKLMEEVGIPEARIRYKQYPFEFSGGMRQRIVIAIALSANPDILICDEPTTALDVTIQSQILELINRLKAERNLSIIFITHDLGVVANMADRIAVMYAGKIVEYGTANEVFYDPRHPYTWALLSSMPDLDTNEKLDAIPGTPPNMIYPPVGDAFAERNKYALEIDYEMQPPMFKVTDTHYAATWLLHPNAPKVEIPKIITERIKRMKERGENGEQ